MDEVFLVDGVTIGKTRANTIQVTDDGDDVVERSHARVHVGAEGRAVLRCLQPHARLEWDAGPVSELDLLDGITFRIGSTSFEVTAGVESRLAIPTAEGATCPYCMVRIESATTDIVAACAHCGKPVVEVSLAGDQGVRVGLPGVFRDVDGVVFAVDHFVARGGMGFVLKAHDPNGIPVAVKVIAGGANAGAQGVTRFYQEIDLLRRVRHANVLRLISHGEEAGRVFLVTEWVDGADLRTCLPSRDRPAATVDYRVARGWIEQTCRGLAAIHAEGAVHRDIKPSNLLLRNDGTLLVADLGVAKRVDDCETGLTSTGQMPGTYWYMAPEQREAPHLVDPRTDIYSLGFTFWEILAGRKPIGGASCPSAVNQTVPKEMDALLGRMMSDRIETRPATVLEVLGLLPPAIDPVNRSVDPKTSTKAAPGNRESTTLLKASGDSDPPDEIDIFVVRPHHVLRRVEPLATGVHRRLCDWRVEFARKAIAAWNRFSVAIQPEVGSKPGRLPPSLGPGAPYGRGLVDGNDQSSPGDTRVRRSDSPSSAASGPTGADPAVKGVLEQLDRELLIAVSRPEGSEERLQDLKRIRSTIESLPSSIRQLPEIEKTLLILGRGVAAVMRIRADLAFEEQRYGAALRGYLDVRGLKAEDAIVTDRIAHLSAERRTALAQATEAMRRGNLGQARERVQRLQSEFCETLGDLPECEQLLSRIRLIEVRVKETIPALRSSRSLYRLSQLIEELSADRVAITGLRELREKTAASLNTATERLEDARQHLRKGQIGVAREIINRVHAAIADHPEADTLEAEVAAEEDRRGRLVQEIRILARDGNYLRVHRLLSAGGVTYPATLGLAGEFAGASSSKRRSDRFLLALVWLVVGVAGLQFTQHLADWLWTRIVDPSVSTKVFGVILQRGQAGCAIRLGLSVVLTTAICHGGRLLFQRRGGRSVLPGIAAVLLSVAAFCVVDAFQRHLVELVSRRGTTGQVEIFTYGGRWASVAMAAVVYATSIMTLSREGAEYVLPQIRLPNGPIALAGIAIALVSMFVPFGLVDTMPWNERTVPLIGVEASSVVFVAYAASTIALPMKRWAIAPAGGLAVLLPAVAALMSSRTHDTGAPVAGLFAGGLMLLFGILIGLRRRKKRNIVVACGFIAAAMWLAWQFHPSGVAADRLVGFVCLSVSWVVVARATEGRVIHGVNLWERSIDAVQWLLK